MAKTKITSGGIGTGAVSSDDLAGSVANAKLANSSVTYNSQTVALGASGTIDTFTDNLPTITSLTPSVITNAQTSVVIAGTNFVSIPVVEAISTTGLIVVADSVTFTSATSITAAFTLAVDGTYYVRVINPDGGTVTTSSALFTVSAAPAWTTAAGSLGSVAGGGSVKAFTIAKAPPIIA